MRVELAGRELSIMNKINKRTDYREDRKEAGFSLVEMVIALVILMIAVMGVFGAFVYSTKFNRGNSQRSQGLSVFQREIELIRSAKFTPAIVSNVTTATPTCASADDGRRDITGGLKPAQLRCGVDGTLYLVETTVDDDPFTAGLVDPLASMKQITLEATPQGADGLWVTANRIRVVLRRVRAN